MRMPSATTAAELASRRQSCLSSSSMERGAVATVPSAQREALASDVLPKSTVPQTNVFMERARAKMEAEKASSLEKAAAQL